jgi:hypothetical protein
VKLRSEVLPTKKAEADNTQNLDLNTSARKAERALDKLSPYLIENTSCVLTAQLSHPIEHFDHEKAMLEEVVEGIKEMTLRESSTALDVEGHSSHLASKSQFMQSEQVFEEPPRKRIVYPKKLKKDTIDPNDAIYERMIIIIPYKSPEYVQKISKAFE